MALPDTLERVGIVVGSALLLALPANALFTFLFGVDDAPQSVPYLLILPGLVVGLLIATDRLGVTYHQVWKFSLASYFVASLGAVVLGIEPGPSDLALSVGWWLVSAGVGVAAAQFRLRESTDGSKP